MFFLIEIAAIYVHYYTLDKVDPKTHLKIAMAFALASWTTMVVIVDILTFMMTPGRWPVTGGFFNQDLLAPAGAARDWDVRGRRRLRAGCRRLRRGPEGAGRALALRQPRRLGRDRVLPVEGRDALGLGGGWKAGPRIQTWGRAAVGIMLAWIVVVAGLGVFITLRG